MWNNKKSGIRSRESTQTNFKKALFAADSGTL